MKLYLNSCEPDEIRESADWGILDGVTMNPSMVAAIKRDYVGNLKEICGISDMAVFTQVVASTADEMTAPYKIWKLFFQNRYTKERWDSLIGDWKKSYGDRNWITG